MVFVKVGNFFIKFKRLETREESDKKIYEILKTNVPGADFKIAVRGKTIHLYDLPPVAKNALFLKKEKILGDIKKALKDTGPNEISFLKP